MVEIHVLNNGATMISETLREIGYVSKVFNPMYLQVFQDPEGKDVFAFKNAGFFAKDPESGISINSKNIIFSYPVGEEVEKIYNTTVSNLKEMQKTVATPTPAPTTNIVSFTKQ